MFIWGYLRRKEGFDEFFSEKALPQRVCLNIFGKYLGGFSSKKSKSNSKFKVLDPFAGGGPVLLSGASLGLSMYGNDLSSHKQSKFVKNIELTRLQGEKHLIDYKVGSARGLGSDLSLFYDLCLTRIPQWVGELEGMVYDEGKDNICNMLRYEDFLDNLADIFMYSIYKTIKVGGHIVLVCDDYVSNGRKCFPYFDLMSKFSQLGWDGMVFKDVIFVADLSWQGVFLVFRKEEAYL